MTNKNILWIILVLAVLLACVLAYYFLVATNGVAAPGLQDQPQVQTGTTIPVEISGNKFTPANIIIKKGSTVIWTNKDDSPHTVTATNANGPHSPELQKNSSYSDTFTTVGTYEYHCTIHPSMKGSVQVVE